MSIDHERQQILRAIAPRGRAEGELLTADQFAKLTAQGQADYLRDLSEREFWAQAEVVAKAKGRTPSAIIASWATKL